MRQYTISVKTGKDLGATTDDNVFIILYGNNDATQPISLRDIDPNAFHVGNNHKFVVQTPININVRPRIELWREGEDHSNWYVNWIEITDVENGNNFLFLVQEYTREGTHYTVKDRDTCLPQNDRQIDLRQTKLRALREEYRLEVKIEGLPAQVGTLPEDECFLAHDEEQLTGRLFMYEAETFRLMMIQGINWANVEDVKSVYSRTFGKPKGSVYFNDDASFGRQRLNGLNSSLLKRCFELPNNFTETKRKIIPLLEGHTLDTAIQEARLFIVDLDILADCPTLDGLSMPNPIALFYFNNEGKLMPIALQLFQGERIHNPVFLPTDPEYTWMAAKMWYSLADATYHQAITHLNFTHLMMEGISVAAKRHLALAHPIMKLLKPHFTHLMAINSLSLSTLITNGGIIDMISNAGIDGHFHIMRRSMDFWRLDVHGTLPNDLETRGVAGPEILTGAYHMRDDALLLYHAINTYVTEYVNFYYVNNNELAKDVEIQGWRGELVLPRNDNGVGILGVPGDNGFQEISQLILTLTAIIYQCSVGHAAVNFQQYDEYGSPFNYPYFLAGTPPENNLPLTEEDILGMIADRSRLLQTMSITKLLSKTPETSIGNYEDKSFVDPQVEPIVNRFRQNLQDVGHTIEVRNLQREPKYFWLHPKAIPNSINI